MVADLSFTLKNILVVIFMIAIASCADDASTVDPGTEQPVPGLKSFQFLASNNPVIYQDIVFVRQADNSYAADLVPEVQLKQMKPTFEYDGKAKMNDKLLVSGVTPSDFPDDFKVEFDGDIVTFRVNRIHAVPVIYIDTENGVDVTSKTNYVECRMRIDGKNLYSDFISRPSEPAQIRGRGNSTWKYYDKKPYRIKLGSKQEVLGMSPEKDWILLANYRDPTGFLNAISFDMARYMAMPYTNTNRFVEVVLNAEYIGLYQLTEQIEQGPDRITIDESQGVLLSLDLDDGPEYLPSAKDNFKSSVYALPISVKHPDEPTLSQIASIKSDFAELEELIKNRDMEVLSTRLDIGSMINFLIIQELCRNVELVAPRSMYIYKTPDGVYHFGPVWDFDGGFAFDWSSMSTGHTYFGSQSWLMGSSNPSTHPSSAYNYISGFFVDMFADETFLAAYKQRWNEVSPGMLEYCFTRLDQYHLQCAAALERNSKRWPIDKDHNAEIEKLKKWLTVRTKNYTSLVANYKP